MNTLSMPRQVVRGQPHLVEDQLAARTAPVEQRVGHRLGLLVHLLGHEVLVAALLGRLEVPGDRQFLGLDRRAVERGHRERARREDGQLVVGQREDLPGVADERGDVRGQQRHVRRAGRGRGASCGGPPRWCRARQPRSRRWRRRRGPGAAWRGVASASDAPVGHLLLDQVGHHLGVGGRGQGVPGGLQLGPQRGVVLDDPVVDEGQPPGAVDVGVGVVLGGAAVGGPAGVPDGGSRGRGARRRSARPARRPTSCRRPPGPARLSPSTTMATPAES